jgi:hypothetical protein
MDLYDVFPGTSGSYRPRVKLAPLAAPLDDTVLLHEEVTNVLLSVNYENGEISRFVSSSLPETQQEKKRFPSSAFVLALLLADKIQMSQGKRRTDPCIQGQRYWGLMYTSRLD